MKYFSWFMKSRNKFATCRGVDEHEYYDEWTGQFKTFKSKQWTDLKSVAVIKMATIARKLKTKRMSIKNIAEVLDRSESRIREYLKSDSCKQNGQSKTNSRFSFIFSLF